MRLSRAHRPAQALVLVALTLGILVTLIIGVNEVALQRRTRTRIQDSLDQAAAAAIVHIAPGSLAAGAPTLLSTDAEAQFRTVLRSGLTRVATAIDAEPIVLAQQAQVQFIQTGGRCKGRVVTAPAICAHLTVSIRSVMGSSTFTFTTLAQVTH